MGKLKRQKKKKHMHFKQARVWNLAAIFTPPTLVKGWSLFWYSEDKNNSKGWLQLNIEFAISLCHMSFKSYQPAGMISVFLMQDDEGIEIPQLLC